MHRCRLLDPLRRDAETARRFVLAVSSLTAAAALVASSPQARAQELTLEQAIVRARRFAPAVVEANGQVVTARATGIGARTSSFDNPRLEVVADKDVTGAADGVYTATATLSIPVELSGQRSARIREADALLDWRLQSRLDTEARTLGAVVLSFGDLSVAAARRTQAEQAQAQARAEYETVLGRAALGDATVVDRSLAESETARYAQSRAEAELALISARERLSILTQLPDLDVGGVAVTTEPPRLDATHFETYLAALLANSPALKSLELESRYYGQQAERARSERDAPVSFMAVGGRGEFGEARAGGGIGWAFPVIRRNEGEVARALAERARAELTKASVRGVLARHARAAFDTYTASMLAILQLDESATPAAERVVDATLESFRAGKTELVRVLNARRDLALTRARRLDLVAVAWAAYSELAAIQGALP